jgi:hypothetical protein
LSALGAFGLGLEAVFGLSAFFLLGIEERKD